MAFVNAKLAGASTAWVRRARQAVSLIPLLALLFGIGISGYVYQYLHQKEFEMEWRSSYEKARESVSQIDLLLANSMLRLQSYEDSFGDRAFNYQNNSTFIRQALQQTIFQRMTIYQEIKRHGKPTGRLRMKFRIETASSQLSADTTDQISGARLEKTVAYLEDASAHADTAIYELHGQPRLSVIMQSKTRQDTILVFTTPLISLFQKTDVKLGDSILVSTKKGEGSWQIVSDESGKNTILPVALDPLENGGANDVYFDRGLPQSGLDIGLQFSFSPSSHQVLSSSNIAGGMSFLVTLIVAYLFHVLISQNRNAKRLILNKTVDLEKTAHDLQEVLNEKSKFLGKVSHEIRTPLNLMLGMIGLCEESDNEKKLAHYLRPMKSSGEHLLSMIDDLIDLAKAEASDLGFQGKRLYLAPFLNEVARLVEQDCRKKGLKLFCFLDPDLPSVVTCDPSRLRQVLLNLLRNACKYTYRGHVILNAIAVRGVGESAALIRFEIQDTGVGIPPDKMEKIFDAFFQVEGSAELAERGVGLGLSIVKDIVSKMGGRVRVRAAPGGGSIFEVDVELESPGDMSWLQAYAAPDQRLRKVYVLSSDPCFQKSFWSLSRHPHIKTVSLESSRLGRSIFESATSDLCCVVVDASMENIDFNEIQKTIPLQNILLFGDAKALQARVPGVGKMTIVDGPASALEVLNVLGCTARGRMRPSPRNNSYFDEPLNNTVIRDQVIKLIVADDDLGNLELYRAYFAPTKWQVEYVLDGLEAWEEYQHERPNLMVVDLRMPGMDGAQLIEKVRAFERTHELEPVPIVLVTADVMEDAASLPLAHAKVTLLTKPVKKQQLLEVIQRMALPVETQPHVLTH